MSEVKFSFSGRTGIIAAVVVVLIVLVRLTTLGENSDAALEKAIYAELRNELGGELGRALDDVDITSEEDIEDVLAYTEDNAIELHSVKVSKPLMSFSSSEKTIVRIEYSLPGGDPRTQYWRFKHALAGGWLYQYETTVVSYYLNFI